MYMYRKISIGLFAAALAASAWAQGGAQNQPPMGFGPGNSPGWSLMTPQERAEHRSKMMGFTKYDDCVAYLTEHHKAMQARAKEKGTTLPAEPRLGMCDRLKPKAGSN
jgi:hypothetical protein